MALALTPHEIVEKQQYPLLNIAHHWERVPLSGVARVRNGFAFRSEYFTDGSGLPLIRIRDIESGKTENFYDGEYESEYVVERGDLLIGMDGDFTAAVWRGPTGLLNQRVCKIEPFTELYDREFLFLCLQPYLDAINAETSSVTVKHLSSRTVEQIPLPLPPLNEQRRIVARIEELFSELDKGVESLTTARAQLKTYRQALLKHAFEGRLTEQWRREHADELTPVARMLERIPPVPRPNRWSTRSKDTILGHSALAVGNPGTRLPDGWLWVPLVDVARMESGHTPSRRHPEWWGGDVPWIGIADAKENNGRVILETAQSTNETGLANSAARLLPAGTVCVSRTASVGYVVEMGTPMATSQDFVNWVPTEAVTSEWLRLVFGADRDALRRFGKGTTHKTIYFPEWLSVHIALPPLEEQYEIVQQMEAQVSQLEQLEDTIDTAIQQAEALRQSILKLAFEGRLAPQDPNDEPAAELLARIRAERQAEPTRHRGRDRKHVEA